MSVKIGWVIIALLIGIFLGMWYQANPNEGNSAMGTFKSWVGRSLRGENCAKGYKCIPVDEVTPTVSPTP
jgi:hypothetical protein